ncbi:MAG: hypothetical protein U0638_05575 [Phycisphaerales bacterium]
MDDPLQGSTSPLAEPLNNVERAKYIAGGVGLIALGLVALAVSLVAK